MQKKLYREIKNRDGEEVLAMAPGIVEMPKGLDTVVPAELIARWVEEGKVEITAGFEDRMLATPRVAEDVGPFRLAIADVTKKEPANDKEINLLLPVTRKKMELGHFLEVLNRNLHGEEPALSESGRTIFYVGKVDVIKVRKTRQGVWRLHALPRYQDTWPSGTQVMCVVP